MWNFAFKGSEGLVHAQQLSIFPSTLLNLRRDHSRWKVLISRLSQRARKQEYYSCWRGTTVLKSWWLDDIVCPIVGTLFWNGKKMQLLLSYNHIAACKRLAEALRQAAAQIASFYPLTSHSKSSAFSLHTSQTMVKGLFA